MRDLDQGELDSIFAGRCPACGQTYEGFYEGGSGGMSLNIFCANDDCLAGYNLMGPDPSINLGGQLIRVSKLGDVRASESEPPPQERLSLPPWWPEASPPLGFDLVLAVLFLVVFVGTAALILWIT